MSEQHKISNNAQAIASSTDACLALPSMYNSSPRHYWIAQLFGWASLVLVLSLTSSFAPKETLLSFVVSKLFCGLVGLSLSHFWRLFLKQRQWFTRKEAFPIARVFACLVLISIVQLFILALADQVFRDGTLFQGAKNKSVLMLIFTFMWFIVFLIWTLCYAVAQSQRRFVRFELEKLQLQVSVKEAELRALQAQINPHFFFNSLNSIRALVYQDQNAAAHAIGQLAGMMRYSLNSEQADTVALAEEIKAVELYLAIEKLRFEERLIFSIHVQAGLESIALPPMILQTLIENAVKHGVEVSMTACEIQLIVETCDAGVLIQVKNQGKLSSTSHSTQLGFKNARKRLQIVFGEQAKCELSEHNNWVIATLILPMQIKGSL